MQREVDNAFDSALFALINFEGLLEEGMISAADLELFSFVESAEEAWERLIAQGLKIGT